MISIESEVVARHLPFFQGKKVLISGGVNDNFAQQLNKIADKVTQQSLYFDYVNHHSATIFGLSLSNQIIAETDLILYYWTKNKQENLFLLTYLLANLSACQEILLVGENRSGVRAVENLLKPFGIVRKIDSARRCGLYYFSLQKRPQFNLNQWWQQYSVTRYNLNVMSLPGVFSANALDQGTELLLDTFDNSTKITGKVLDLGCGAGVIGSYLKSSFPSIELTMCDIHALALLSAEKTLEQNTATGEIVASDVFSHINEKFDFIVSNPPFHNGMEITYQAVEKLISQAKEYLISGGKLRIVANAFLPYPHLLDQYFGDHQVLAKNNKFKVYQVSK
ncbi:16S rRNA (guanine(1207)-N(2))-methyltransferase [Mergibacter septicus]|uniref:16S rRNA (guanine(1207)-N(2))-methyltransferase RsmC n=1 Tax=Mergibacter septicus TaxID=221402 RepID=UPI001C750DE8|nr:16S rRNA (guanine(1207)-N(2))-methyltransferase RsmC [Mergibacter septicus]QDJ12888.1 16S rRNA (guanine(1207)-N(2))-methyltransferase [Mergibacter septicus]